VDAPGGAEPAHVVAEPTPAADDVPAEHAEPPTEMSGDGSAADDGEAGEVAAPLTARPRRRRGASRPAGPPA